MATTFTDLRNRAGLSLRELALATGLSKSGICRLQAGGVPSGSTLLRLAKALGRSPGTILAACQRSGK